MAKLTSQGLSQHLNRDIGVRIGIQGHRDHTGIMEKNMEATI